MCVMFWEWEVGDVVFWWWWNNIWRMMVRCKRDIFSHSFLRLRYKYGKLFIFIILSNCLWIFLFQISYQDSSNCDRQDILKNYFWFFLLYILFYYYLMCSLFSVLFNFVVWHINIVHFNFSRIFLEVLHDVYIEDMEFDYIDLRKKTLTFFSCLLLC